MRQNERDGVRYGTAMLTGPPPARHAAGVYSPNNLAAIHREHLEASSPE